MLCKHNWELLSETVTESQAEQAKKIGCESVFTSQFDKKLIQIVTCKKCGKLKRFVTDI